MLGNIGQTYSGTDASHEILLMLFVASIIGFILGWLLKPQTTYDFSPEKDSYTQAKKTNTSNKDDLQKISGIGPALEQILKKEGIHTYLELSQKTPEELKDILLKSGKKYKIYDPSSWPEQARIASESKWGELKEFQEILAERK